MQSPPSPGLSPAPSPWPPLFGPDPISILCLILENLLVLLDPISVDSNKLRSSFRSLGQDEYMNKKTCFAHNGLMTNGKSV